jgi:hypothetical protein
MFFSKVLRESFMWLEKISMGITLFMFLILIHCYNGPIFIPYSLSFPPSFLPHVHL